MPFSEAVKLEVKRRAHFMCCLCHSIGVEVHHIIPQAEGGNDVISNAAPLCPSCHETYGANPTKRRFIREARDFWNEICARRYAPDSEKLEEVAASTREIRELLIAKQVDERLGGIARISIPDEPEPRLRDRVELEVMYHDHLLLFLYHSIYRSPHLASEEDAISGAKRLTEDMIARFGEDSLEPITDAQLAFLWERLMVLSWIFGVDTFRPGRHSWESDIRPEVESGEPWPQPYRPEQ